MENNCGYHLFESDSEEEEEEVAEKKEEEEPPKKKSAFQVRAGIDTLNVFHTINENSSFLKSEHFEH